jgi:hypothetical protein
MAIDSHTMRDTPDRDDPRTVAPLAAADGLPPPLPGTELAGVASDDEQQNGQRRTARRRPAGPSRNRLAANDDVPTIGGLIYALEQKPSTKPFQYAAVASGAWTAMCLVFAWFIFGNAVSTSAGFGDFIVKSNALMVVGAIAVPIALFFFLALIAWRAEELRLRSSTMTEVAIRLAEPDRMAEQSIASLGQAVRRQVSFMNDAVGRALGRAGELEALVHNEVAALERSYEENERKIRGLIQELAGERHALVNTSEHVTQTLRGLGTEIPALIDKLSGQQITLAKIIEGAGQNLTALESAITQTTAGLETTVNASAGRLEGALGTHATHLQSVLEDYTTALGVALGSRTQQMQAAFDAHARAIDAELGGRVEQLDNSMSGYAAQIESHLGTRTQQLEQSLATAAQHIADAIGTRTGEVEAAFSSNLASLDASLAGRTQALQSVFEEYGRALDTTLARRADALDSQLVERTKALDDAFSERLRLFDESIQRSTLAIDGAITDRSAALSAAMDNHAKQLSTTLSKQAGDLDETLMHGITSVRRTSEAITRQSIKAIESLASQSEMLKNISENLLGQIGNVTGRFEQQGAQILKAASTLENANYKIDTTLQSRHADLSRTLDRLSGKAEEFGQFVQGYSTSIEGSIGEAERRARMLTDELRRDTEARSRAALEDIERLRSTADVETQRALEDLRGRFSTVSNEVTQQLGSLTSRFDATSEEVRQRAAAAASELENEQRRLRQQIEELPRTTQSSAEAMRRTLQDQLKAIEQLTALTQREAARRDVAPPVPLPSTDIPYAAVQQPAAIPVQPTPSRPVQAAAPGVRPPEQRSDRARALSSLTSGLAQEMAQRQQHPALSEMTPRTAPPQQPGGGFAASQMQPTAQSTAAVPPSVAAASASARDSWSLGDLLARASVDDDHGHQHGHQQAPSPPEAHPAQAPAQQESAPAQVFNVAQLARALDGATASAIWSKLRGGQRGVMVRSIYSAEGRATFDDVSRRYAADTNFQATVNRYLMDFERILRETEQNDPSGRQAQTYANSETGRVYLFLAHASGRLS